MLEPNALKTSDKGSNHNYFSTCWLSLCSPAPFSVQRSNVHAHQSWRCIEPWKTTIWTLNPGKRLYELDNALNKVVDCGQHDFRSTRMQLLRSPKAAIGAAQRDPNFLFPVGIWVKPLNHKSKNPDHLDAEFNVRQTLRWTTGSGFMEAFKQRVRRQEKQEMCRVGSSDWR